MLYAVLDEKGRPLAFYDDALHGDAVPEDAVPISVEAWRALRDGRGAVALDRVTGELRECAPRAWEVSRTAAAHAELRRSRALRGLVRLLAEHGIGGASQQEVADSIVRRGYAPL